MKYKSLEKLGLNNRPKKGKVMNFLNKVLMAVFLGLVALIVMEYSPKFKSFMQKEVLDKNISFAFFNNIYEKYFGEVLPQTKKETIPVFDEKLTFTKVEKYLDGANLTVSDNYLVPTLTKGVVVFIGEREDIGKVITIEGEDNTTITYGNIKEIDAKLYDYLEKGKYLGEVNGNTLYISVLKNGEYQDIETYLS